MIPRRPEPRTSEPPTLAARPQDALTRRFHVLCGLAFALLSMLSLVRHATFHSSVYDVGIFHQLLWNTAHGRPFETSLKHMSYLGDHFSPSFALLAPLEWLPHPIALLLLAQAASVAWTAATMHRLALDHLDAQSAFLVGAGTLFCPALYCPVLADIHPEPFVALCVARALLALDRGRLVAAAVYSLVALGGKEDVGLLLGPMGFALALAQRGWQPGARGARPFGVALCLVSLGWSALAMAVLMPRFRPPAAPDAAWFYLGRYSHLGASVHEVARTVLLHPLHAIAASFSVRKAATILLLLLSFGIAPLFSPRTWIVVPLAAAHYFSNRWTQFFFPFHYLVPLVPVIAFSAIAGAPRLLAFGDNAARAWRFGVIASSIVAVVWRLDPGPLLPRPERAALRDAIDYVRRSVPAGESLCVENWFGAHLADRERLDFCVLWEWERAQYRYFHWPDVSSAHYQLFDLNPGEGAADHPALRARYDALRRAGAEALYARDDVYLLRADDATLARAAAAR